MGRNFGRMKKFRGVIYIICVIIIWYLIGLVSRPTETGSQNASQPLIYETPKTSMYGNPTISPRIPDGIVLNDNMDFAIHEHEDGVRPNGLANETPWKYGTTIRTSRKENWSRIGLWGQVYLREGYNYLPQNTAIELKDFKMYILNPQTLEWKVLFDVVFTEENTLFYDDNYVDNYHQQFYSHKRIENNGESVVIRFDEQNFNFNFHPYSQERFDFISNNYMMENGLPYVISTLSARLVKWDEGDVDDLDEAEFIFNVGGDYWDAEKNEWQDDWSANGEIGEGRFIKIGREWRTAWFTNVPYELCDELIPEYFYSIKVSDTES